MSTTSYPPNDKLYIYRDGSRKTQNDTTIGIINPEGQGLLPSTTTRSTYDGKYFTQMGGHPINTFYLSNTVYYFQDWTDISNDFSDAYSFDGSSGNYTGYQYFLGNFYHFVQGTPYRWYIVVRHNASNGLINVPYYTVFDQFTIVTYGINPTSDAIYSTT